MTLRNLCFFLSQRNSLSLHCFPSSFFFFLYFDMGNGGALFCFCLSTIVLMCPTLINLRQKSLTGARTTCLTPSPAQAPLPLRHCLQFEFELEPSLSDQVRAGTAPCKWATGWSHRQWIFTQLTCILFYCQIKMTVLANITNNSPQNTALIQTKQN